MFRCQICRAITEPGTPATAVVIQEREREYPPRTKSVAAGRGRRRPRIVDEGGRGHEIVRELQVCPTCAEAHQPQRPEEEEPLIETPVVAPIE